MADGSNLSYSMAWRETSGALTQNEGNWTHRAEQSCLPSGLTEPLPCGLLLALISDSLSFYLLCPHALLPGPLLHMDFLHLVCVYSPNTSLNEPLTFSCSIIQTYTWLLNWLKNTINNKNKQS